MAVRVMLVLAAVAILYGCAQASSPAEKQEKQGSVEETVGGGNATARAGKGDMVIEKAFLRRDDRGDEIVVRAKGGNSTHFPSCYLTEGTSEEAGKRAEAELEEEEKRGKKVGSAWGAREDSLWPKEVGGEMSVKDGAFMIVFHEDPNPSEEIADPRRTPFFAHCAGGDSFKELTSDSAHVQGTPKAP
jgi:hypothetical protein